MYPYREVTIDGIATFVEMTEEEYENSLINYKKKMGKYLSSEYRKEKEYGSYLKLWFSEEICDGAPFSLKYKWKKLPMSFNQYFFA